MSGNWLFEKINKIDKSLSRQSGGGTNSQYQREVKSLDSTDIKRTIWGYFEQLYAKKFNCSDERDTVLKRCKLRH